MNTPNARRDAMVKRRGLKMPPYDRAKDLASMRQQLSLDMLEYMRPVVVGSVDDFCDYIVICHNPCTRKDATKCSLYPRLDFQYNHPEIVEEIEDISLLC